MKLLRRLDYLLRWLFPMCVACGYTTLFPRYDCGEHPMHYSCHKRARA